MSGLRCSVCGKTRQAFAGSTISVHAACIGTAELHDEVLAVKEKFPRVTVDRLARDLGVTKWVVEAWMRAALRRRAAARRTG